MSKTTVKRQPISQLQLFIELIEKMHRDTQKKMIKLNQSQEYSMTDSELALIMHALHRQRENYATLLEQLNIWKSETSDVSKLHLIETALQQSEEVNLLSIMCQQLTNHWIFKTTEGQGASIFKGDSYGKPNIQNKYSITEGQVQRYQQFRESIDKLFTSFFIAMSKDAIDKSAKRLEILRDNSLLLNTVFESNVFFDYCFYQHKLDNLNVIQRSFQESLNSHEPKTLELFKIVSEGKFAYLDVIAPIGEAGVVVYDRLTSSEHLMIDKGLNNIARKLHYYTLVTHTMDFGDFLMTTGASIPVSIHTEEGIKVERRFRSFLNLQNFDTNSKDYKQYVTDIYKICLHEDITGDIKSPPAPFGKEALDAIVNASDSVH